MKPEIQKGLGSGKRCWLWKKASQVALVIKNSLAYARDIRDLGSIPGLGKIPRRRKQQSTPVFLPGESHRQRSLTGYSRQGSQRAGHESSDLACTQAYKDILLFSSPPSLKLEQMTSSIHLCEGKKFSYEFFQLSVIQSQKFPILLPLFLFIPISCLKGKGSTSLETNL